MKDAHFDRFKTLLKISSIPGGAIIKDAGYMYSQGTPVIYDLYVKKYGLERMRIEAQRDIYNTVRDTINKELDYCQDYENLERSKLKELIDTTYPNSKFENELLNLVPLDAISSTVDCIDNLRRDTSFYKKAALLAYMLINTQSDEFSFSFWEVLFHTFSSQTGTDTAIHDLSAMIHEINTISDDNCGDCILPQIPAIKKQRLLKFDNFDFLLEQVKTFNEKFPRNKISNIHIDGVDFPDPFAQHFAVFIHSYVDVFGIDMIKDISPSYNTGTTLGKYVPFFIRQYDKDRNWKERFMGLLFMMGRSFQYEYLCNYAPVSLASIYMFINDNIDSYKSDIFEDGLSVLFSCLLYDLNNSQYANDTIVATIIRDMLLSTNCSSLNDKYIRCVVNSIIDRINDFGEKIGLPLLPCLAEIIEIKRKDNSYIIPWKNIVFDDGFFKIVDFPVNKMHNTKLCYVNSEGFFVKNEFSKKEYNSFKLYFEKHFPNIMIRYDRYQTLSCVCDLDVKDYFRRIIPQIINVTRKPITTISKTTRIKSMSKREFQDTALFKKSIYLEELCRIHKEPYRIYEINELRSNSKSFSYERGYAFIIGEINSKDIYVAFENILDSRSTLIFLVKRDLLYRAINVIGTYLSSEDINKRQSLAYQAINFNDFSIISYERVIHTDYNEWRKEIRYYERA